MRRAGSDAAKALLALRSLLLTLAIALGLAAPTLGCLGAGEDDVDDGASAWGVAPRGSRPVDVVERFPTRQTLEFAMHQYLTDPRAARARDPVSVPEFFGREVTSANIGNLRVEMLKPNPRFGDKPVAFLWTRFHDGDMYWNNRYKDVQLRQLVEATGAAKNPFPEAVHVKNEGSALVRIWTDYRPVSEGAPAELHGSALAAELARMSVWSYVSGNVDGPAHNGSNGGFARFRDASGRESWQGVLIDAGAAWNAPGAAHQPWNTNLLGRGPVLREHIPQDVVNSLVQIARASAERLAEMSKFEVVDEGAKEISHGIRGRAQEVLEHYGIRYQD